MRTHPGEFVVDTFDDPVSLDPHRAMETGSQNAVLNVYDGLLGFDADRRLRPVLAAALPTVVERGGQHLVAIPVRDDVTFHDGRRMTVDDVVYSLRRCAVATDVAAAFWTDVLLGTVAPQLDGPELREMLRRIEPTSDGVLLRLDRPYGPIGALLAQWSLVVSRDFCAVGGDWDGDLASVGRYIRPERTALDQQTNGTGPYLLEAWDRQRGELRYRKVARVFAPDTPGPDRVVLRTVDDSGQREQDLVADRCDLAVCLVESRDRLRDVPGIRLDRVVEARSLNPLAFVTQRLDPYCKAVGSGEFGPDGLPPDALSDVHLRRMLSLCFDHQRYGTEVLGGETLPYALPFPAAMVPGLPARPPVHDLAAARDEFEQAWDGLVARRGCRLMIFAHDTNTSRVRAAELLAEGLTEVSDRIVVEVCHVDLPTLLSMTFSSQCPIAWTGWVSDFMHPYALVSALLDPRAPLPAALGITDPVLVGLVEAARDRDTTGDGSEDDPYRLLHEYTVDNALYLVPPGKVDHMMQRDRWTPVGMKNHTPHVLDFTSFRPRTESA